MFDLKTEKWFIRVKSEEQAAAVQQWAFTKGLSWAGCNVLRDDYKEWEKRMGVAAIGSGHYDGRSLGQASPQYWLDNGHKEIEMSFKTVIDSIVYPQVESTQQKQIRELEHTIALATKQIQELKKDI
uniref:Uncharacterized protein n=2 Tax=unclassified bacterial viruses TaxID=12333 RepID=A0AAU6VY17_9VIRU